MLLQFPFIRRQKLTRELLFSASIHLKSKCLGRKRLNLLMEKDYSPATGIFSSSFTLEQSFSIPRQNMQLHEAAAALHYEVSGNHWQSFRTRVLLANPSPPPLAIRNSFYTASCVTDGSWFPPVPLAPCGGSATPSRDAVALGSSAKLWLCVLQFVCQAERMASKSCWWPLLWIMVMWT